METEVIIQRKLDMLLNNCLNQTFGRPTEEQKLLNEFMEIVREKLGNDGLGFSYYVKSKVFQKGGDKD